MHLLNSFSTERTMKFIFKRQVAHAKRLGRFRVNYLILKRQKKCKESTENLPEYIKIKLVAVILYLSSQFKGKQIFFHFVSDVVWLRTMHLRIFFYHYFCLLSPNDHQSIDVESNFGCLFKAWNCLLIGIGFMCGWLESRHDWTHIESDTKIIITWPTTIFFDLWVKRDLRHWFHLIHFIFGQMKKKWSTLAGRFLLLLSTKSAFLWPTVRLPP